MYCTGCGREMTERDNFCPSCGKPAQAAPAASEPKLRKRLYRPMRNKKIAGVCAGFAQYLDVDVTVVRIVWLVVALLYGTGLLAYIIAWIAMPKEEALTPAAT